MAPPIMSGTLQRNVPMLLALMLHGGLLVALLHRLEPMLDQTDLSEVMISLVPLQKNSASRQTRSTTHRTPAHETYQTSHQPAPRPDTIAALTEAARLTETPSMVTPDPAPTSAIASAPLPASIATTTSSTPATQPTQEIRAAIPSTNTAPATAERAPATASGADYLVPPKPTYPISSRRTGEQGKVLLRILIDEKGHPERVEIHLGSGYLRLDEAARVAAQRAVFKPHLEEGRPVPVYVLVPINFSFN